MNRRAFLGLCLATGVAPAYVRAASMMRMVRRESGLVTPAPGGHLVPIGARRILVPRAVATLASYWCELGMAGLDERPVRFVVEEYSLLDDGRLVPWQENAHHRGIEVPDFEVEIDLR